MRSTRRTMLTISQQRDKATTNWDKRDLIPSNNANQAAKTLATIKDRELHLKIAVLLGNPQLTSTTSLNVVVADEVAVFRSVYFAR